MLTQGNILQSASASWALEPVTESKKSVMHLCWALLCPIADQIIQVAATEKPAAVTIPWTNTYLRYVPMFSCHLELSQEGKWVNI